MREEDKNKKIHPSQVYPIYAKRRAFRSNPWFSDIRTMTGARTMVTMKRIRTIPILVPKPKAALAFRNTYTCTRLYSEKKVTKKSVILIPKYKWWICFAQSPYVWLS
jgi:hypothetical protein